MTVKPPSRGYCKAIFKVPIRTSIVNRCSGPGERTRLQKIMLFGILAAAANTSTDTRREERGGSENRAKVIAAMAQEKGLRSGTYCDLHTLSIRASQTSWFFFCS